MLWSDHRPPCKQLLFRIPPQRTLILKELRLQIWSGLFLITVWIELKLVLQIFRSAILIYLKQCLVKRLSCVKKKLCLLDQDLLHMSFSFPCPNIHSHSIFVCLSDKQFSVQYVVTVVTLVLFPNIYSIASKHREMHVHLASIEKLTPR